MSIQKRLAAILAVGMAGALAVAGIALAAAHSTATVAFSPRRSAAAGDRVHVREAHDPHAHDLHQPGRGEPWWRHTEGQLHFDDDLRFNTNAVPKCAPSSRTGDDVTLQAAMAASGSSLIGQGTVKAIVPDNPNVAGDQSFFVNGCLRVFNGQGATSEVLLFVRSQVTNPSNINCSTNGTQGTFSDSLAADLTANPGSAGADYADPDNCSAPTRLGCQLDLNNIPSVSPLPLVDFNAAIQQGGYVAARCDDTPAQLNLRDRVHPTTTPPRRRSTRSSPAPLARHETRGAAKRRPSVGVGMGQGAVRPHQHLKQLPHLSLLGEGLGEGDDETPPCRSFSAPAARDDVAVLDQLGDQPVGGALRDAHGGGDVAQPQVRLVCDAEQHLGVVREELAVGHRASERADGSRNHAARVAVRRPGHGSLAGDGPPSTLWTMASRRQIWVKDVPIGGGAPIAVQTMTKTETANVAATMEQIHKVADAGSDLVRVAVPREVDVEALKTIVGESPIPVIADIHFNYTLALKAIDAGAHCIRLNPGNIGAGQGRQVAEKATAAGVPMRIGVNSGSLPKHLHELERSNPVEALAQAAVEFVELMERLEFQNFKVSIKSTNVPNTIAANRLLASKVEYPIHLGITEAGTKWSGSLKSAVGLGTLLADGVGDTIRISLSTFHAEEEVKVGWEILKALGLRERGPVLIACPTCGRLQFDMDTVVSEIEQRLEQYTEAIEVAVLGCAVNGIGEASHADFGITGAKNEGLIFAHGKPLRKVPQAELVDALFEEIDKSRDSGGIDVDASKAAEGAAWLQRIEDENAGELTPERIAKMEAAAAKEEGKDITGEPFLKPVRKRGEPDEQASPVAGRRFTRA